MQISGTPPWAAPHSTGHPLGLPAAPDRPQSDTRIAAARDAAAAGSDPGQQRPFAHPTPQKADAPKTAPPSIMQLRITSHLQEQAQAAQDSGQPQGDESPQDSNARNSVLSTLP
ncbi:hypothetical protein ACOXXX_18435 [Thalassococcus sp. BH17M4-6]|uniref:hypothetical protein n=1 Tax=Thalassococcus sp. BH17M4-6 TaxID=3413148 RepID=UPI003BE7DFE6